MSNEDTLRSLGKLIPAGADVQRDAVHIAVAPAVAGETLRPGTRVYIAVGGEAIGEVHEGTAVGVVDPFMRDSVQPKQRFWLYLNPGSITSLRHDWTHPAFPASTSVDRYAGMSESERWIREWCDRCLPISYEVVMDGADSWVHSSKGSKWGGDYLVLGGLLEGEHVPDEFWKHYEAVRGTSVPDEHKQSFFSCSC